MFPCFKVSQILILWSHLYIPETYQNVNIKNRYSIKYECQFKMDETKNKKGVNRSLRFPHIIKNTCYIEH